MFYSGYYKMAKIASALLRKNSKACGNCLSFLEDMQCPICVKKTVNFLSL